LRSARGARVVSVFMSALVALLVSLLVLGELAGVVEARGAAPCGLFVPALGVGDVLAPGELLLGTVCDGVLVTPVVVGALPLVCPLADPKTANAAMDARDMTTAFLDSMVFSPKRNVWDARLRRAFA
jgi:hypothetical protein